MLGRLPGPGAPGAGRVRVDRRVGMCPGCGYVLAEEGHIGERARCPSCGAAVRLVQVEAEYSGARPCDDRCQFATGPRCVCACGGVNHCAGYIDVPTVPGWVRDRDRNRAEERKRKARRTAEDRRAVLLAEHPELGDLLGDRYADAVGFLGDMRSALEAGRMTERQVSAAVRAVRRDRQRAERDAREAELVAAGVAVPEGRHTFTGVIRTVKRVPAFHGPGTVVKGMIAHADGWRVWGTLPRALRGEELAGREVVVTATLQPSGNDPLFGFFARPMLGAPTRGTRERGEPGQVATGEASGGAPGGGDVAGDGDPWGAILAALDIDSEE